VVLGGGFAGVTTALELAKRCTGVLPVDITLISDRNFFLFTPILAEAATGAVETRHVIHPIRPLCTTAGIEFGEMRVELLGTRISPGQMDRFVADPHHGIPCDLDGPLDALVRGAPLGMEREGSFRRLARSRRHGDVVVDVDGSNPNGLADAGNVTFHGGPERLPIEGNFAPCQGATQGAVHSAGHGSYDVVQRRRDEGSLADPIVLAELPLHAVDDRFRYVAEPCVAVAIAVFNSSRGDVLEVVAHGEPSSRGSGV
jgi:hypothetical protein